MLRIFKHDGTMEREVYLGFRNDGGFTYLSFKDGDRDRMYDYCLPDLRRYNIIKNAKVVYV